MRPSDDTTGAAIDAPELLDQAGLDPEEVEKALGELRRVNRWLLGHGPARRTLLPRLDRGPAEQVLLDVGTGSGDVAAGLARRMARSGRRLSVIGVDLKLAHLLAGCKERSTQLPVVADARALPFRDAAVDWSLSTLFFHHLDAAGNRLVLAEMRRVARQGAVVIDLRASRFLRRLGPLLIAACGAGAITRHDGRVSLARAWPLARVRELVAGQPVEELRHRFPFRFSLVLSPTVPSGKSTPAGGGGGRPAL